MTRENLARTYRESDIHVHDTGGGTCVMARVQTPCAYAEGVGCILIWPFIGAR